MNENVLDFHTRQAMIEKTYELAAPIYHKMRSAWPDIFDTMAAYEQDTVILSVNGYSRFIEYLKTAFNNVALPVSMIINYRSALVLNFNSRVLKELEIDLFSQQLLSANGQGMPGLLQLTGAGNDATLSTDITTQARPFDVLAAYLFLYNTKYFVYNLDVKIRPDEEK